MAICHNTAYNIIIAVTIAPYPYVLRLPNFGSESTHAKHNL